MLIYHKTIKLLASAHLQVWGVVVEEGRGVHQGRCDCDCGMEREGGLADWGIARRLGGDLGIAPLAPDYSCRPARFGVSVAARTGSERRRRSRSTHPCSFLLNQMLGISSILITALGIFRFCFFYGCNTNFNIQFNKM